MAHKECQFLKTVVRKAYRYVVKHMVVRVRAHGDRSAKIFMLRTQTNRNDRKDQHRKIGLSRFLQRFCQILTHRLRDNVIRAERSLIAMLLQRSQRNEYNRLFFIDGFHLQPRQIPVVSDHDMISCLTKLILQRRSYRK